MRLVEKKCPNCGGALKFGINDRETTCEYCNKSFEIERDTDKTEKDDLLNADFYSLTEEQKKAATAVVGTFAAMQIVPIAIFVIFFALIVGFGIFGAVKSQKDFNKQSEERQQQSEAEQDEYDEKMDEAMSKTADEMLRMQNFVVEFEDLTDAQLKDIHDNTESILNNEIKGHKEFMPSFGKVEYVGMYLLKNYGTTNYLYDVYKVKIGSKYYFTSVLYRDVKVIDKKLVVDMSGRIEGKYNPGTGHKDGTFGYESAKDYFNKTIRGKLSDCRVLTSGDVYSE